MKKLINLKGVKKLDKNEQKNINGGYLHCLPCQCLRFVPVMEGGVYIGFRADSYLICIGESCAVGYTMECM